MNYTNPILYKISAFDVDNENSMPYIVIAFTYPGDNIPITLNGVVDIYDNNTNILIKSINGVFNRQSISTELAVYNLKFPFSEMNGLYNGSNYYMIVSVENLGNIYRSNSSIFNCYETPRFSIIGINQNMIIHQSGFKLEFSYIQENNVLLNWYQCELYNGLNTDEEHSILRQSSNKLYDTNYVYTFKGLENNGNYYIKIIGETIDGFYFEQLSNNFSVQYTENANSSLLKLENIYEKGYIKINTNINAIPGVIENSKLLNGEIDLKNNNSKIAWQEGLDVEANPLTLKTWLRCINNNEEILRLSNSQNDNYINIEFQGEYGDYNQGNLITTNVGQDRYLDEGDYICNTQFIHEGTIGAKYIGCYYDASEQRYYAVVSRNLQNWLFLYDANGDHTNRLEIPYIDSQRGYMYVENDNQLCIINSDGNLCYTNRVSTYDYRWTEVILNGITPRSIVYDGNRYYAFGENGYAYSDSYTFSSPTIVNTDYSFIKTVYYGNIFLSIINNNNTNTLCYSTDGVNWSSCFDENYLNINIENYPEYSCIITNSDGYFFYKIQQSNDIYKFITYYSQNGVNWQVYNNDYSFDYYYQLKFWKINTIYYGIIKNTTSYATTNVYTIIYSFDGITWHNLLDNIEIDYITLFTEIASFEIQDNNMYLLTNRLDYYSLIYNTFKFKVTAKGNVNTLIKETDFIQGINFDDWIYLGVQITFGGLNDEEVESIDTYIINQQNQPGGA